VLDLVHNNNGGWSVQTVKIIMIICALIVPQAQGANKLEGGVIEREDRRKFAARSLRSFVQAHNELSALGYGLIRSIHTCFSNNEQCEALCSALDDLRVFLQEGEEKVVRFRLADEKWSGAEDESASQVRRHFDFDSQGFLESYTQALKECKILSANQQQHLSVFGEWMEESCKAAGVPISDFFHPSVSSCIRRYNTHASLIESKVLPLLNQLISLQIENMCLIKKVRFDRDLIQV